MHGSISGFVERSVRISSHTLSSRFDGVPKGEMRVQCTGGMRAAIAASLPDVASHAVVFAVGSFDGSKDAARVARTARRCRDRSTIQADTRDRSEKPG